MGNFTDGCACWSETAQYQMGDSIGNLCKQVQTNESIVPIGNRLFLVCLSIRRSYACTWIKHHDPIHQSGWACTVNFIAQQQSRQQPIMRRILEQVCQRHRGMTESMHKQRFQFPFQKVEHHQPERDFLDPSMGSRPIISTRVKILWQKVEQGVDNQRSRVFHQENGTPGNLRSQILE